LKSFFILDLVTSIPVELLFDEGASFNKLFRLLRFPRFVKILKFERLLVSQSLKYYIRINGALIKSVILGAITLILLHISTCVWCFLGLYDESDNTTWVYQYGLQNDDKSELYAKSFYFMLVTLATVGYGDMLPRTNLEIVFIIFWMVIGVLFYSLVVGLLSAIFTDRNTKAAVLARQTNHLYSVGASLKIAPSLINLMANALANNSNKSTYFNLDPNQEVLGGLPVDLKYDFLHSLYGPLIQGNAFFKDSNKSFIIRIIPLLRPLFLSAGTKVFVEGSYSRGVYLLEEGSVEMSVSLNPAKLNNRMKIYGNSARNRRVFRSIEEFNEEDSKEERVAFKLMTGGAFFGDTDVTERRNRLFTVTTLTDSQFFVLNRTDFETVIVDEFPSIFEGMKALGRRRDKDDMLKISKALQEKFSTSSMSEMDIKIKTVLSSLEICKHNRNNEYRLKPLKAMYQDIKEQNMLDEFMHTKRKNEEKTRSDSDDARFSEIESDDLTTMHQETSKIGEHLQTRTQNTDQSGMTPRKLRNLEKRANILQNPSKFQSALSLLHNLGTMGSQRQAPLSFQKQDSVQSNSVNGVLKPKVIKVEERYLTSLEEEVRNSRGAINGNIKRAEAQLERLEAILEDMHRTEIELESSHYYTLDSDEPEEPNN
jgi:CRP-like cAMP-binding protein